MSDLVDAPHMTTQTPENHHPDTDRPTGQKRGLEMSTSTYTGYANPGAVSCHCSGCDETFTSLTAFDAHRVNRRQGDAECANPTAVGLILRQRVGGTVWGFPGDNPTFEDVG